MKMILIAATACAMAACGGSSGPNVLGDYGGDSCTYENISLRPRRRCDCDVEWSGDRP